MLYICYFGAFWTWTCFPQDMETVEWLLRAGADPNKDTQPGRDGQTALEGFSRIMRYLRVLAVQPSQIMEEAFRALQLKHGAHAQ